MLLFVRITFPFIELTKRSPGFLIYDNICILDRRLMDIFRGVIRVGEFSPRVLLLTADILEINSANYTVW